MLFHRKGTWMPRNKQESGFGGEVVFHSYQLSIQEVAMSTQRLGSSTTVSLAEDGSQRPDALFEIRGTAAPLFLLGKRCGVSTAVRGVVLVGTAGAESWDCNMDKS